MFLSEFSIEYKGRTFPGYNKPIDSDRPNKKKMVLAKAGDKVILLHFGDKGYRHNYSHKAKKSYLARASGIKDGSGNLTRDNKLSPNYWAIRTLWPKNKKIEP